jgi:hypothetical protein
MLPRILQPRFLFLLAALWPGLSANAQQITGLWRGKINRQKVELKMVLKGDSLTGTSYYYASAANYRRYTIKGYFDPNTNQAVWWDDQLIEERTGKLAITAPGTMPMLSRADFNCPGGGVMMLDGSSGKKDDEEPGSPTHLEKTTSNPNFPDEWDFVIDNYTTGANHPDIIDSISRIAFTPVDRKAAPPRPKPSEPIARNPVPGTVVIPFPEELPPVKRTAPPRPEPPVVRRTVPAPITPPTIEQKFTVRKKILTTEIPIAGDSIELRFYDNAEIDGDSISLFLDGRMLFTHIRLSEKAYIIKIPVSDLGASSELVMVAENLGSIPPNTSYMVAISGGKRYEARLASDENSSAAIKLVRDNR